MEDLDDFETVFGDNVNLAYDEETRRKILHYRQSLENELFIDRLLEALGVIDVSRLYPPVSNQDLHKLHDQITSSASPDHHKHSVIYYLLRDIFRTDNQVPENFAKTSYLPSRYKTFTDGMWYMDRLKFEKALGYLTEASLIPTFSEEILYILCTHAPGKDVILPVSYYQTVSPCLTSSKVLEAYFDTLCHASITEAFHFSRTQGGSNQRVLFEKVIAFVHKTSNGKLKAARGVELISLPLGGEEEYWFREYLKDGEGSRLSGAADTLKIRGIAIGRSDNDHQRPRTRI